MSHPINDQILEEIGEQAYDLALEQGLKENSKEFFEFINNKVVELFEERGE